MATQEVTRDHIIQRIFEDAALLLERDGWTKRTMGPTNPDVKGPRCASGAIVAAATKNGASASESSRAHDLLKQTLSEKGEVSEITRWNDRYAFSSHDVTAMFRTAAMRVAGRAQERLMRTIKVWRS